MYCVYYAGHLAFSMLLIVFGFLGQEHVPRHNVLGKYRSKNSIVEHPLCIGSVVALVTWKTIISQSALADWLQPSMQGFP